jgi:hypothetical protein
MLSELYEELDESLMYDGTEVGLLSLQKANCEECLVICEAVMIGTSHMNECSLCDELSELYGFPSGACKNVRGCDSIQKLAHLEEVKKSAFELADFAALVAEKVDGLIKREHKKLKKLQES